MDTASRKGWLFQILGESSSSSPLSTLIGFCCVKRAFAVSSSSFTKSEMTSYAVAAVFALASMRAVVNLGGRMMLFDRGAEVVELALSEVSY